MSAVTDLRKLNIATDGLARVSQQDPPGQRSVYIPSGDTWKESYRLSTFSQFFNSAVLPSKLAASGFYYTGFKDRVKCFRCGLTVEDWVLGDDPTEKRWHQSNCDFANGRETNNEPTKGPFWKWRRLSPILQNTHASSSLPSTMRQPIVISGGNYVQQHVPSSQNLPGSSASIQGNSSLNNIAANTPSNENNYPCDSPLNPHMTSVVRRSETFKTRNGIRWPSEKLRASVEELVNAGFFFLGERDRVKCFYCNGGLQNWEYEDDPWIEHVKWFPSCKYALRVKGPEFVQNIVDQFPDLDRPTPTRPRPRSVNRGGDVPPVLSTEEAVEQAISSISYVKQAIEMGFNSEAVKAVLKRKYDTNQRFFSSGEEFMEALLLYQIHTTESSRPTINSQSTSQTNHAASGNQEATSITQPNGVTGNSINTTDETNSIRSVASELQELENSRLCKKCKKSVSNVVLIPCGHLASCEPCARVLKKCPICNRKIHDTMKAFRS